MNMTETEKDYLEKTNIDNAMIYKELKALREELSAIRDNTTEKVSKKQIMSIKNPAERHKAIRENMELFKDNLNGGEYNE